MKKNDIDRRTLLKNSKSPINEETPSEDRRGFLKKALATTATVLGLPALGSVESSASSEAEWIIDRYSEPEVVQEVVERNREVFGALNELGVLEETRSEGLQVSAVPRDGGLFPELKLYIETAYGTASVVMTPEGDTPHSYFVATEEQDEYLPFPREMGDEIPFDRVVYKVSPKGFEEPGFENAEVIEKPDPEDVVDRVCKDPIETMCGPVGTDDGCDPYFGCCGKLQGYKGCSDDDDGGSVFLPKCRSDDDDDHGTGCGYHDIMCWSDSNGFCRCTEIWTC